MMFSSSIFYLISPSLFTKINLTETMDVDEEEMTEIDEEAFALQAQQRMEERIAITRN